MTSVVLRNWSSALRIHQWTKNFLLFVPIFLGHVHDYTKIATVLVAFLPLSALVSGTYILNDIVGRADDRRHPQKRRRPFASGQIGTRSGIFVAAALIAFALLAGFYLATPFGIALLVYLALSLSYTLFFRRVPFVDVSVIAILFTLRILMGIAVLNIESSAWLLSFSLMFFLSLALAKRLTELREDNGKRKRLTGRGYEPADWPVILAFGAASSVTSIAVILLYLANDAAPSGFYVSPAFLYGIPIALSVWCMRIWLLAQRGTLRADPVVFALEDPQSWALGALVAISFALAHVG